MQEVQSKQQAETLHQAGLCECSETKGLSGDYNWKQWLEIGFGKENGIFLIGTLLLITAIKK